MTIYVEVPSATLPPHEPPRRGERGGRHPNDPKRPEGAAASSWPVISITSTAPSDRAKDTLLSLLSQPDTDSRHKNDFVCKDFVKYLDQCEQKGFMIKGYDTKKGKVLNLPMSYNNRWGYVRRNELSKKLDRLEYWFESNKDRPVTLITLTAAHPDNVTVQDAWQKLNVSRVKLLKLIKKYCGAPDYFWVTEPHPTKDAGYAHYHLAVFADVSNDVKDSQGRGLEDKLRDLWSKKYETGSHTYGLKFSQKKQENKIISLKNYLIKYLRKGYLIDEWSIGTLIFNAHLWDNKFRLYGASKAISHMMKIEDDHDTGVVWLETRMQTIELTPENEEVQIDKVIWYRQYIPDWIDSPMWLGERGEILGSDPPAVYFCDWGRPLKTGIIYQTPAQIGLSERQRRKLEADGYL